MFVNYLRDDARPSPLNLAVARVLLGGYLVWDLLEFDLVAVVGWPIRYETTYTVLVPPWPHVVLPVEKAILLVLVACFVLGLFERWAALLSVVLLWHLAAILYTKSYVGRVDSLFVAGYFLVFFGLYAHADELSLDAVRRTGAASRDELGALLESDREYAATPLKWGLLAIAVVYFGSAWAKAMRGPLLDWATATSLGRWTVVVQTRLADTALGNVFLEYPLVLRIAAVGTILMEGSLLVVTLLGLSITAVVLGLAGMHAAIALSLGPFFFDQFVFLSLFAAWDDLYRRLLPDEKLAVVYDGHCHTCAQVLYPFSLVFPKETSRFYAWRDAPEPYRNRDDVNPDAAIHAFADGRVYEGYDALCRLLGRAAVFEGAVVWLLTRPPVEAVGVRVYEHLVETGRCERSESVLRQ